MSSTGVHSVPMTLTTTSVAAVVSTRPPQTVGFVGHISEDGGQARTLINALLVQPVQLMKPAIQDENQVGTSSNILQTKPVTSTEPTQGCEIQTGISFNSLPVEIRCKIYELALAEPDKTRCPSARIVLVNRIWHCSFLSTPDIDRVREFLLSSRMTYNEGYVKFLGSVEVVLFLERYKDYSLHEALEFRMRFPFRHFKRLSIVLAFDHQWRDRWIAMMLGFSYFKYLDVLKVYIDFGRDLARHMFFTVVNAPPVRQNISELPFFAHQMIPLIEFRGKIKFALCCDRAGVDEDLNVLREVDERRLQDMAMRPSDVPEQ